MTAIVTVSATTGQGSLLPFRQQTRRKALFTIANMATEKKPYLFITEYMDKLGLSDAQVAEKMGVSRETVWRWQHEQHRLDTDKIADLARTGLGIEPEQLWFPPDRQSVDAVLKDANEEEHQMVFDLATRIMRRKQ
jgi:transcriptional regulator with XRE-family HTH domain